jgi:adenine specific DNA methylase Mod
MTYTKEQWRFNDNSRHWKTHPFSVTCRKTGVSSATIANIPARATISLEEQKANARLIAAAPELLGALMMLDKRGGLGPQTHKYIRSIIAKATGEH